ncbi:hypothetical protein CRUP_033778 [Coryphaenoides rupestris]|nr:hypothetical protein CRUP_033778 [Coryphaenoides rupestris]
MIRADLHGPCKEEEEEEEEEKEKEAEEEEEEAEEEELTGAISEVTAHLRTPPLPSLLAHSHLLVVRPRFTFHVCMVMLKAVIVYVWEPQQLRSTGDNVVR